MAIRLLTMVVCFILSACAMWPAGDDPNGSQLNSHASLVLMALNKFQVEHGRPPQSFSELVPAYLTALPSVPELMLDVKNKLLVFNYLPSWPQSGQVSCSARIGTTEWKCHGYI